MQPYSLARSLSGQELSTLQTELERKPHRHQIQEIITITGDTQGDEPQLLTLS